MDTCKTKNYKENRWFGHQNIEKLNIFVTKVYDVYSTRSSGSCFLLLFQNSRIYRQHRHIRDNCWAEQSPQDQHYDHNIGNNSKHGRCNISQVSTLALQIDPYYDTASSGTICQFRFTCYRYLLDFFLFWYPVFVVVCSFPPPRSTMIVAKFLPEIDLLVSLKHQVETRTWIYLTTVLNNFLGFAFICATMML